MLVDDLIWLSKIPLRGQVLDVGCGTGKSTEPFAMRGFEVCALDPGANMLAVCKNKLRAYPNVKYQNIAFETCSVADQAFDLVVSGTAFHWVTEAGYAQLMRVLRPQGAVGIFWHTYLNGKEPFYERLDQIYQDHAPNLYVADLLTTQELDDRRKEERLLSWTGFGEWRVIRYYDRLPYSAKSYVDLLRTWSTHMNLTKPFFKAVEQAIKDVGGEVLKPIRTTLCFGRRKEQ
jgi:ubiquinone/menaquinone biosynthesis C-methylase UbiE